MEAIPIWTNYMHCDTQLAWRKFRSQHHHLRSTYWFESHHCTSTNSDNQGYGAKRASHICSRLAKNKMGRLRPSTIMQRTAAILTPKWNAIKRISGRDIKYHVFLYFSLLKTIFILRASIIFVIFDVNLDILNTTIICLVVLTI